MVMGDDSCSKGRGFESWRCILEGHFFTLICYKNCIVCLKEAGVSPLINMWHDMKIRSERKQS